MPNNLCYGIPGRCYFFTIHPLDRNSTLLVDLSYCEITFGCVNKDAVSFYHGEYFADILISEKIIVEIKAVKNLAEEHEAQLLNYLKAILAEKTIH